MENITYDPNAELEQPCDVCHRFAEDCICPEELVTMNDEEKSVALAKLCGWIRPAGNAYKEGAWVIDIPDCLLWSNHYWNSEPFGIQVNFYDLSNMHLAWHVVCWLNEPAIGVNTDESDWRFHASLKWRAWWSRNEFKYYNKNAQRAWLDKILELAIKKGMIEGAVIAP